MEKKGTKRKAQAIVLMMERSRRARDNEEKNEMWEIVQMKRKSKIVVERDAGGRKRCEFFLAFVSFIC